jgi:glutamyl-tRNA reductase
MKKVLESVSSNAHTQILDFFMILQTCNRVGAECITTAASRCLSACRIQAMGVYFC